MVLYLEVLKENLEFYLELTQAWARLCEKVGMECEGLERVVENTRLNLAVVSELVEAGCSTVDLKCGLGRVKSGL